ncbi:MAG: DegT/DnrJ/EryC1/StrS family aminotransferase [Methanobacteriota archaeon]
MKINFVDLKRQYTAIRDEIRTAIDGVLETTSFILGEDVSKFEEEFASFCDSKYCVGVGSGTEALHLALLACGVGPGDEVITVPNTYIATVLAITYAGAKPVFVDIDPETYNIDVSSLSEKITAKTQAILPIHLYGQPADMDPILDIAAEHDVRVVEDACQAHGSEYKGKRVGSLGDVGCFSFYPGKNLGAYGDGGAITTNNEEVYEKVMMLRNYGQKVKYHHLVKGFNSRLDTMQAAILRVKLRHLETWNELRRKNAQSYTALLEDSDVITPIEKDYSKHVYHLYVVRSKNRDGLAKYLGEKNVYTGIHYPIPVHLQEAYRDLGHSKGDFPVTEEYSKNILSLPMFPELTSEEVEKVAEVISDFN